MEFINDEISAYYPNGEKIHNDEFYDYAQVKPTDVSFSNPEQFEMKENNTESNLDESKDKIEKFRGPICRLPKSPDLSDRDLNQPTPPPRLENAKKLEISNKSNSWYEFHEPNIAKQLSLEEKKSCEYITTNPNKKKKIA